MAHNAYWITTPIEGCALITDNGDLATAFISFVQQSLTAGEFLKVVRNIAEPLLIDLTPIVNACMKGFA